jgi:ankyrin repeat protein
MPTADAVAAGRIPGHAAKVAQLVKAGAPVNQANFGATPLARLLPRYTGILKVLLQAGADPNPEPGRRDALMVVARTGNVEAARLLLQHGAQVDAREKWGGRRH